MEGRPNVAGVEDTDQAAASEGASTLEANVQATLDEMQTIPDGSEDTSEILDGEITEEGVQDDEVVVEPDGSASLISEGHLRAALAAGWTREMAEHFMDTRPEEAVSVFNELYDKRREESAAYSAHGRRVLAGVEKSGPAETDKVEAIPVFDAKTLIEEYGNDDLITALIGPLNAMANQVNAATAKLAESEQFVRASEQQVLQQAVNGFFASTDLSAYHETYGTDASALTSGQVDSRVTVLREADAIIAGASAQGREVTPQEALERAHMFLTEGTRVDDIRREIAASMKRRTKTSRSTQRQASVREDADQPITMEELERRVATQQAAMKSG